MSFRISLCNEVVADREFAAQCDLAAELGYDGLEVAPFTLSDDPARIPGKTRARLARAAADAGMAITGLHWLLTVPEGLSITTSDADLHAATVDHMCRMVDLCADLGGGVLVHGSPAQRRLSDAESPQAARDNARRAFAAAARAAEEVGVTYCIEPLAPALTDYVTNIEEACAIVRDIGAPHLRTMIDTSAAWGGETESPADLIGRHMPDGLLNHVHLNDTNRRGPGQGVHCFASILRALRDTGFVGVVGVEPFDYHPDGPTAAARCIGYLAGLWEQLEGRDP